MTVGQKLTLVVLPLVFVGVAWALFQQMAEAPSREAGVTLDSVGLFTVELTTVPNPPVTTGIVQLQFMLRDPRGRAVTVDRLSYEYGPEGGQVYDSGVAEAAGMAGMYVADVRFSTVGNWWLRIRLVRGSEEAEVRFRLTVRPSI